MASSQSRSEAISSAIIDSIALNFLFVDIVLMVDVEKPSTGEEVVAKSVVF